MCDGDKLLVLQDRTLIKCAKRNMQNIVPLYYEMRKGKAEQINADTLYHGMALAFTSGNIGPISNNITKVWNNGEITQEAIDSVKRLCLINNETIDFAKTLYRSTPPKQILKSMQKYTRLKVPNFFQYAKDKKKAQCEDTNSSTMNRISDCFKNESVKFAKTVGKFNYKYLLSAEDFEPCAKSYQILERYDWWNRHKSFVFSQKDFESYSDDAYIHKIIREKIMEETECSVVFITDSLVYFLYRDRKNSSKKLLWACFGEQIVENLRNSTKNIGRVCPICGKRFEPQRMNQRYCNSECYKIADRQKSLERWNEH